MLIFGTGASVHTLRQASWDGGRTPRWAITIVLCGAQQRAPKALSPKGDCVVSTACIAIGGRRTHMHIHTSSHFSRCMMENRVLERRRLLQLVALGSLAMPPWPSPAAPPAAVARGRRGSAAATATSPATAAAPAARAPTAANSRHANRHAYSVATVVIAARSRSIDSVPVTSQPGTPFMSGSWWAMPLWQSMQVLSPVAR